MPKSPIPPQTVEAPEGKGDRRARRVRSKRGGNFLVFVFRLLLLGVGGSIAALIGMMVAQLYPAPENRDMPIVERVMSGSQALWSEVQQLPRSLQENFDRLTGQSAPKSASSDAVTAQTDSSTRSSTRSAANSQNSSPANSQTHALSSVDRQTLERDVSRLQQELRELGDRATGLEVRVGAVNPNAPIESRLTALQQQLESSENRSASNSASSSADASATQRIAASAQTATPAVVSDEMKVTLPTDALFDPDQQTLRPEGILLLDSLLSDLQSYSGASIQIVAHTDEQGTAAIDRSQTLAQAKAIEQYLTQRLGKNYKWSAIGQGHTQPLVDPASPEARQRNRRVEIVIRPKQ